MQSKGAMHGPGTPLSDTVVTEADDGKSVRVRLGEAFVVRLQESPTTGFRWEIHATNEAILSPRKSEFSQEPGQGIGGGGLRSFEFRTASRGTVQISMKLWRDWEGEGSVTKRFQVTVHVV